MKARDVMSHPVVTLRPHTSVRTAAAILASRGFTAAPVVTAEGELLGIATESDLVRGRVLPDGWVFEIPPDSRVSSVMTPAPRLMSPDDDLVDVAAYMLTSGQRAVLIADHGRLRGIVTQRDMLRVVAMDSQNASGGVQL